MRLKKRFMVCALLVCLISMIGNTTLAYYTGAVQAHNVITTSGVSILLRETKADRVTPFEDVTGVMPGQKVEKVVWVENTQEEAYVRILCNVTIQDAKGNAMAWDPDVVSIDFNQDNWKEYQGAWYYRAPLGTGKKTEPLFTKVVFDGPGMGNEYQGCKVRIDVQAQAVQTANNTAATPWNAGGWPKG